MYTHIYIYIYTCIQVVHLGDPDGCAHEQYDILKIVLGTIATLTLLMGLFMSAHQVCFVFFKSSNLNPKPNP